MAYINAEDTKKIRQALKAKFPEFKWSVRKRDSMKVSVTIEAGPTDFSDIKHPSINQYHTHLYGDHQAFFDEVLNIIKTAGKEWYDKSDSQIDYFNVAFYIDLNVGRWDKPYVQKQKAA